MNSPHLTPHEHLKVLVSKFIVIFISKTESGDCHRFRLASLYNVLANLAVYLCGSLISNESLIIAENNVLSDSNSLTTNDAV